MNHTKKLDVRTLTQLAILVAIELVMKLIGLGSVPVGPLYMSFLTVPIAVGAIVLLGTAAAFSLIMQGIVDVGPAKASMLASTEPVSATVFSALWLGTSFSATDLIGFAAITATVFLLAKSE